jgi:hypothetical protein
MLLPVTLLLLAALLPATAAGAPGAVLYVAPSGDDGNSGGSAGSALATCAGAVSQLNKLLKTSGLPHGGVEVRFSAGQYPLNKSTTCGSVTLRGTAESPIVFRAVAGVIFDAAKTLDTAALAPVTNQTVAALINPDAKDKVMVMPISKSSGWSGGQLLSGNTPLTASIWPNPDAGLGYVRKVFDKGAVYAQGRTKGPKPECHLCTGGAKSTTAAPCGANISLVQQPKGDWQAELDAGPGFGDVRLEGYLQADWYHGTHQIAKVVKTETNTSLQFSSSSRYGITEQLDGGGNTPPGRFKVHNLLSEVDMPGEWWLDKAAQMLYIYPLTTGASISSSGGRLGFQSGPGLISLLNCSHVTVRGFTVSGSSSTCMSTSGGENNTIGGNTLTASTSGVSVSGGHHNRVVGNDVYDVTGAHITTSGNSGDDLKNLVPTSNLVANNHITQVFLTGGQHDWSERSAMGDRWSHNLIHDAPGQVILPGGPLTMWDSNEIFNTGFVEGDGGVMYSGASLTQGYGVHHIQNFVHHSLEVPGLHGRGGIYYDDHMSGVANASGNVLYKAAGRAFLVNGGAGMNLTHNLLVNGGQGIYNQASDDKVTPLALYDNGTLKRGDKGDYIYKTEQSLGVKNYEALFSTPFAKRFATFRRLLAVNSTTKGWASAMLSNFRGNIFLNNSVGNICMASGHDSPTDGLHCDDELTNNTAHGLLLDKYMDRTGSGEGEWAWFPGAAQLEFVNESLGFDTRRAGLVCDEFRRSMPVKAMYRPWLKTRFDGERHTNGAFHCAFGLG